MAIFFFPTEASIVDPTMSQLAAATTMLNPRKRAAATAAQALQAHATYTYTFGDVAENHARNQQIGAIAAEGFSAADLRAAQSKFESRGLTCTLVDLGALDAYVLVVRQPLAVLGTTADDLQAEIAAHEPDKKVFMYGRVVNKHARWNLCMAEAAQDPDYDSGKGTVLAFDSLPHLKAVREALPAFVGPKASALFAELNVYYDPAKCGIGYHGDTERRKVIAFRLGATMPLFYQWFQNGAPRGARIAVPPLHHGDMYIMSQKAVGTDWKLRKIPTLRHAAGCDKFTVYKGAAVATTVAATEAAATEAAATEAAATEAAEVATSLVEGSHASKGKIAVSAASQGEKVAVAAATDADEDAGEQEEEN